MEMSRKRFEQRLEKGYIGEEIIREYLENKGWIVYFPFTKDKPHYFDMLCTKKKEEVIAVDVKTKARFNKWKAQGIDIRHYNEYMNFVNKTKLPFYLFFVDDKTGDVHFAELIKLKNSFNPNAYIIAWPLTEMTLLMNIGADKIIELSKFDQRNYTFNPLNT